MRSNEKIYMFLPKLEDCWVTMFFDSVDFFLLFYEENSDSDDDKEGDVQDSCSIPFW